MSLGACVGVCLALTLAECGGCPVHRCYKKRRRRGNTTRGSSGVRMRVVGNPDDSKDPSRTVSDEKVPRWRNTTSSSQQVPFRQIGGLASKILSLRRRWACDSNPSFVVPPRRKTEHGHQPHNTAKEAPRLASILFLRMKRWEFRSRGRGREEVDRVADRVVAHSVT